MEIIESINSSKIKIVTTVWDIKKYPLNTIYAQQTDVAMKACSGDWLIYIQGDEALHEEDYPEIKSALINNYENKTVEGFVFKYNHFWGDYNHVHRSHFWYKNEIRIVRNIESIHSWKDAQSFRKFKEFDNSFNDYMKKYGSDKLKTKELNAFVYHYGHVRPPRTMMQKHVVADNSFRGRITKGDEVVEYEERMFNYGPLNKVPEFKGTHPAVMKDWISKFDWADDLQFTGELIKNRELFGHEKPKQRLVSWLENNVFGGKQIWGFKNYISLGGNKKQ